MSSQDEAMQYCAHQPNENNCFTLGKSNREV